MKVKRALLSVYDKAGLVELGQALSDLGVELIGSGGTARALRQAGLTVLEVSDLTGFPEVLGGRVKTLHPVIHAGLLARPTPEHMEELRQLGIKPIDLVVVNLYPFAQTIATPGASLDDIVEQIDIGGVALLRAAAKNFARVAVLVDPRDYGMVLDELRQRGEVSERIRRRLAQKAFTHTASYDTVISRHLYDAGFAGSGFPEAISFAFEKVQDLRYGENPHQKAALYRESGARCGLPQAQVVQGKPLSYNNIIDAAAALAVTQEFQESAVSVIKHNNPCGAAVAADPVTALKQALASDPVSAFGSVISVNRPVAADFVEALDDLFVEVLLAPGYSQEALGRLARRADLRVLVVPEVATRPACDLRKIVGGGLVQTPDHGDAAELKVVTRRQPTEEEMRSLRFAWKVAKHVKSSAIVLAQGMATVGVGAGQMSPIDSVWIAARKAGERARGAAMASDAMFPFADGIEVAAGTGVTSVIQSGGSVRDQDVIAAADKHGLAMVFTGMRHLLH
ncbi:MAG: bifunctional phosphoribosylaminoimidazolecarboxamide formyltransferase/IMP cyclohydrolase [Anaerolineae bacterium]|nr:bifunctional phosphoribosylaminoimidazolecarboxamide formyltransferase/IMP cyclohydrolase [Anaerolineae bacterium]